MTQSLNADLAENGLASIQFNRPEKGNMYDEDVLVTLITALDDFARDERVHVLHISGEGNNFCLGADPDWLRHNQDTGSETSSLSANQITRMLETLLHFPVPTLAEVQGRARAGALGILACCDYVIGTRDSRYLVNEINASAMPVISTPYLYRALGERRVRTLMLTGGEMSAEEALDIGLIQECVEPDALRGAVENRIGYWLETSPATLRQAKVVLRSSAPEVFDPERSDELAELLAVTRRNYGQNG